MVSFKLLLKLVLGVSGLIFVALGVMSLTAGNGCGGAFICIQNPFPWVGGLISTLAGIFVLFLAWKV